MSRTSITRRVLMAGAAASVAVGGRRADAAGWSMPRARGFRMIENSWIEMRDGIRLAARLWIPEGAARHPVGVVLEYIPYRTRDLTRVADDIWGAALASHGFAYARVDVRGSGNSSGRLRDEYAAEQQEDALEVIAWLARQSWCNGAVGMRGYSWGGNTSLQAASRRPPALKAIVAGCPTTDRYATDAHWIGGMIGLTNFHWGALFKANMALAPDPDIFGDGWRAEWMKRLDGIPAAVAQWVEHQHADAYWATGSTFDALGRIRCPVYAVSGQLDAYRDSVLTLLEGLRCPRKGLIGNWGHSFPQDGSVGPRVDWLEEEVRWWSHWLAGQDTGIMEEPMFRAYVAGEAPIQTRSNELRGHWIAERSWPSRHIADDRLFPTSGRLDAAPGQATEEAIPNAHIVGLAWREWLPFNVPEDLPRDQAEDDGYSLTFDSAALTKSIEIVGRPKLKLKLRCDRPVAVVVARLTTVDAEGRSWPVSYGVLNLCQRHGAANPAAIPAGSDFEVEIDLEYVARTLPTGTKIRLALSQTLWPMIAPGPGKAKLQVLGGRRTCLTLPCRTASDSSAPPPRLAMPEDMGKPARTVSEDVHRGGALCVERRTPCIETTLPDTGTTTAYEDHFLMKIDERDPTRSLWSVQVRMGLSRKGWDHQVLSRCEVRISPETFTVTESITVSEAQQEVFNRTIVNEVGRRLC